jgi:bifunctional DNA-binding transcriptional regulator/antitoxin component of YhaV-PrlF toxin-antitoxin module
MADIAEYLVSASGQMSVPAAVRHRWGLDDGGKVAVLDLGEAVVLLPGGAQHRLLERALPAEEHLRMVQREHAHVEVA